MKFLTLFISTVFFLSACRSGADNQETEEDLVTEETEDENTEVEEDDLEEIEGTRHEGSGRGTNVFERSNPVWKVVHEHLSTPT